MHPWHDLSPGTGAPRVVEVFVEIPRGGRVKYEIDKDCGLLRASRVLYGAIHSPANYGFVPRTLDDDGAPPPVNATPMRGSSASRPWSTRARWTTRSSR